MQSLYLIAGVIAAITGVVHSGLGELLVFLPLRVGGRVPTRDAPPLRERHVRILWATWHLGSVFGWGFSGMLLWLAFAPTPLPAMVAWGIAVAYLGGSALVLVGTRGRHPGWIALLAVALLTWVAAVLG